MPSLKQTITEYLKDKDFVHKGELGRKAVLDWGYENENLGRRCRELENEGKIERLLKKNEKTGVNEVWYRLKTPNLPQDKAIPQRVREWQAQFEKPVIEEKQRTLL